MMILGVAVLIVASVAAAPESEETALLQTHNVMKMIRSADTVKARSMTRGGTGGKGDDSKSMDKYMTDANDDKSGGKSATSQKNLFKINRARLYMLKWPFGRTCWTVDVDVVQNVPAISSQNTVFKFGAKTEASFGTDNVEYGKLTRGTGSTGGTSKSTGEVQEEPELSLLERSVFSVSPKPLGLACAHVPPISTSTFAGGGSSDSGDKKERRAVAHFGETRYRISPNWVFDDSSVKVLCYVDATLAASGWYVTELPILQFVMKSEIFFIKEFWAYEGEDLDGLDEDFYQFIGTTCQVLASDEFVSNFALPMDYDISSQTSEQRWSSALSCVGAAFCLGIGSITKDSKTGAFTWTSGYSEHECRLRLHSAADLHVDADNEDIEKRVSLQDVTVYNGWSAVDGDNMGKFSLHNQLEPRHRNYYLHLRSNSLKAARHDKHMAESVHELFATRLLIVDQYLFMDSDEITNQLKFPEVRGLSHTFPASTLCMLLDVANLGMYSTLGSSWNDDFSPKLWPSGDVATAKAEFYRTAGMRANLAATDALGVQYYAVAVTRKWGRVRCDPLTDLYIDSTPSAGDSPKTTATTPIAPGIFYPPCLFAVDSTNKFLAALQLELGHTGTASNEYGDMSYECEQYWWLFCGGGSHLSSYTLMDYPWPEEILTMLNNGAAVPDNRECLCTGPTILSNGGVGTAAPDWTGPIEEGVQGYYYNEMSGDIQDGYLCPSALVEGACAKFWCSITSEECSAQDVAACNSHCGYVPRSATAGELELFYDQYDNMYTPCVAHFPFDRPASLPVTLAYIDDHFEVVNVADGVTHETGKTCDITQMHDIDDEHELEIMSNYDPGALIESVGSMGMHLAVIQIPPFGLPVGALTGLDGRGGFTDPGYVCKADFQAWMKVIKTSYNGYFYRGEATELASATSSDVKHWARDPARFTSDIVTFSHLTFKEFRAQGAASAFCAGLTLNAGATLGFNCNTNGWVMRSIADTCICAYSYGVDCPLWIEGIDSHHEAEYTTIEDTNFFSCCAIMKLDNLHTALETGLDRLNQMRGTPLTADGAVETLMRLGFQSCPWHGPVSVESNFGYTCPHGSATAGTWGVGGSTFPGLGFPWVPRGKISGGGLSGPMDKSVASQVNDGYPEVYAEWMQRTVFVGTPPQYDETAKLWSYSVGWTSTTALLRAIPLFSNLEETSKAANWGAGTHNVQALSPGNAPLGSISSGYATLTTPAAVAAAWNCGSGGGNDGKKGYGTTGCVLIDCAEWASLAYDKYIESDTNANTASLYYMMGSFNTGPCHFPWTKWYAFNTHATNHNFATFFNLLSHQTADLYPNTVSHPWDVAGHDGVTFEAAEQALGEGDYSALGKFMHYCAYVSSLHHHADPNVNFPIQYQMMCLSNSPTSSSADNTDATPQWYVAGLTLFTTSCRADLDPYCLLRVSNCAVSGSYTYPDHHLCHTYPTPENYANSIEAKQLSWAFGLDRTFSSYLGASYALPTLYDPDDPNHGSTSSSHCDLWMQPLINGVNPYTGAATGNGACNLIEKGVMDSTLGCLGDWDLLHAGKAKGGSVGGGFTTHCGFSTPCIFMKDWGCMTSNRDFLSYDSTSWFWAAGAATKEPVTTMGVYSLSAHERDMYALTAEKPNPKLVPDWGMTASEKPWRLVPAKGVYGFSSYTQRTCFGEETFYPNKATVFQTNLADHGETFSTNIETLEFALRMKLYAHCVKSSGSWSRCTNLSPPRWYVCKAKGLVYSSRACRATYIRRRVYSSMFVSPFAAPWFKNLGSGSYYFPVGYNICTGDETASKQVCYGKCTSRAYSTCKCSSNCKATVTGSPVATLFNENNVDARHLGWFIDRMDGWIDDTFGIETAYAGPVAHDGGYIPRLGGGFLPPYTRVQGGVLLRPLQSNNNRNSYEAPDAAFVASSYNGATAAMKITSLASPSTLTAVTVITVDSGVAYMHSEFRSGTLWPWMTVDPMSGASSMCWGTQAINPLFKLNLPTTSSGRGCTLPTGNFDDTTKAHIGGSCGATDRTNTPYTLSKMGFTSAYCDAMTDTSSDYEKSVCDLLKSPVWAPFQRLASDVVKFGDNGCESGGLLYRYWPGTGSSLPHYKLAPSRMGTVVDGTTAVCDGFEDAYRYLGLWKPQWSMPSWCKNGCSTAGLSDCNTNDIAQLKFNDPVCHDAKVEHHTSGYVTEGNAFNAGDMTVQEASAWGSTMTAVGYQHLFISQHASYLPWSYDSRNGNMCHASTAHSSMSCYVNDPRTCMVETIPQIDWGSVGLGNDNFDFDNCDEHINFVHKYKMMLGAADSEALVLQVTDLTSYDETAMGYLCRCGAPENSVFHPPWDWVEAGALLGPLGIAAEEIGWGYWGAPMPFQEDVPTEKRTYRDGNSPFFDHCPCGTDVCGHGTGVAGSVGAFHFGLAVDMEQWAMKITLDNCINSWFSFSMTFYMAGHSYRLPSVISASTFVEHTEAGSKDAVAEAAMYCSYRMGLTIINAAGNDGLDGCLYVPGNLSPYIMVVGATMLKLAANVKMGFVPEQNADFTKGPGDTREHFLSEQVTWWSNAGDCVDVYAPGEKNWGPITNVEVDIFGRDWGMTMLMKLQGTSFATPRTAAVMGMIFQAHLEISFVPATMSYAKIDQCKSMFNTGTTTLSDAYLANNHCREQTLGDPVISTLPDPLGCTASTAFYTEASCTLGFWHNDGRSCGQCGGWTVVQNHINTGTEGCTSAQPCVTHTVTPNVPYRPMFQTQISNRNKEDPSALSTNLPYHMLYLQLMARASLMELRSEVGSASSLAMSWYKPHQHVSMISVSPCGGGRSTQDYFPGIGRICCPLCSTVEASDGAGGNHFYQAAWTTNYYYYFRCRWPYLTTLPGVTCSGTACPGPGMGMANWAIMLLAKLQYTVAGGAWAMRSRIGHKIHSGGTFSLTVPARRPVTVDVPHELPAIIGFLRWKYNAVGTTVATASVNQLYVSSLTDAVAITLDDVTTAYQIAGEPKNYGGSSEYAHSRQGSLIAKMGCVTNAYFPTLPWCVFGSGLYKWDSSDASMFKSYPNTATGVSFDCTVSGTNFATVMSSDEAPTCEQAAIVIPSGWNVPTDASKTKFSCMVRHYDFLLTLLDCAISGLDALIWADPGCLSGDLSSKRYGCLCRRRTRYLLVEAVQEPTVSGKTASEVAATVATGNQSYCGGYGSSGSGSGSGGGGSGYGGYGSGCGTGSGTGY
jgi:hypothetical protein